VRAHLGLLREALTNLVATASSELADVPQAEPVRRRMLEDAVRIHRELHARRPDDPELQLARLAASEEVGRLERQLGRPTDAVATLQQCVAEAVALRAQRPDSAAAALQVAS